ncbi:MAG: DUF72 domain-containing protein [Actinomycetota bacterium]
MPVLIGTSGWQYKDWRGTFYPPKLAQRSWLDHYARCFQTVEVNNAFYRLPEPKTFAAWAEATPEDFVVAVKASRFLTHVKRLKDPDEPVARFVDHTRHLGAKLGPVLLQLPPNLHADCERLDRALALFPREWRLTVEFRHDSWWTDETESVLRGRGVALCLADSPRRRTPVWRTADWTYLRLHEGRASPHPCYGRTALRSWAERLADMMSPADDVYVYFNNDGQACAVRDAHRFALAVDHAGLHPTRVPGARDVRLAE